MSKTKAVIAAELADAKRTIASMRDELDTALRNLDIHFDQAQDLQQQLRDKANATVYRMGDRKPWKLIAIVALVAFVIGWVL